ncbi:STAS domain-containing protein [Mycolicibacterium sp. XJ870]
MPTISVAKRAIPLPGDSTNRAQFAARRLAPTTAIVSVHGELDASNAPEFTDYTLEHAKPSGKLVLDLSTVAFFGAACFATLHTLNIRCAGEHIDWVLVPSKAVLRVLRICDPDSALPTSATLAGALSTLQTEPRQLQLVADTL